MGATRALLLSADQPLGQIAKGSKVSYRWLIEFKAGRVENPTLRKLQGLHSYLTKVPDAQPN